MSDDLDDDYDDDEDDASLGDVRDEVAEVARSVEALRSEVADLDLARVARSLEGLRSEVADMGQAFNAVVVTLNVHLKVLGWAFGAAAFFVVIEILLWMWRVASHLMG